MRRVDGDAPAIARAADSAADAPGTVESRPVAAVVPLSAGRRRVARAGATLPWKAPADAVVGAFAQRRGSEVPDRVVASAKSWLSYAGADRDRGDPAVGQPATTSASCRRSTSRRAISPTSAAPGTPRSRRRPLAEQDVLLTVPASFDPVARELTVRAADEAGPAAGHAARGAAGGALRLDRRRTASAGAQRRRSATWCWSATSAAARRDFSLIAAREEGGALALERVAVGDHILLGGDNMDLALAYARARAARRSEGTRSTPGSCAAWSRAAATPRSGCSATSRRAEPAGRHPRPRPQGGRRRAARRRRARRRRARRWSTASSRAARSATARRRSAAPACRSSACRTPTDAARHAPPGALPHAGRRRGRRSPHPTAVLFNGGVMRAAALRQRLLDVLDGWFAARHGVRVLAGADPELAVARGAAYYGLARRGRGVRIRGGIGAHVLRRHRDRDAGGARHAPADQGAVRRAARPGGRQRGRAAGAGVRPGRRRADRVPLPQLDDAAATTTSARCSRPGATTRSRSWRRSHTTLEWQGHEGATVPVHLQARVNEVGVLELWCVSRDGAALEARVQRARD